MLQAGGDFETGFVILSGHVELRTVSGALVEQAGQGGRTGGHQPAIRRRPGIYSNRPRSGRSRNGRPGDRIGPAIAQPRARARGGRQHSGRLDLVPKAERAAAPKNHESPVAAPAGWSSVRIRPGSSETRSGMPRRGIKITEMPFGVGRKPFRREQTPRVGITLMFGDSKPDNLSRSHFVIERGNNALMIRDVGSKLGTVVNGERIGIDERNNAVPLHIGENEITAGGADTPFAFIVDIEP